MLVMKTFNASTKIYWAFVVTTSLSAKPIIFVPTFFGAHNPVTADTMNDTREYVPNHPHPIVLLNRYNIASIPTAANIAMTFTRFQCMFALDDFISLLQPEVRIMQQ